MELKPGDKQTDVGLIPEEWGTVTLERACVPRGLVRGPFGGALKKEVFVKDGKKVYEQRNAIYRDATVGNYFISDTKFRELKRFATNPGDFIVSCSGTIGRIFEIPRDAQPGVINQALLKIETDGDVVDSDYFFHYFDWEEFQRRIVDNTHGGAMQNLVGMSVFRNLELAHPPLQEQRAIAAALTDVDALIGRHDRLIAKKRDLKQAVMQQLLSGQRRLPDFNGEWEVKRLEQIGSFSKGQGIRKDEVLAAGIPCVRYGEIYTRHSDYIRDFHSFISAEAAAQSKRLQKGDLLFAGSGETAEEIGKCVAFLGDEEAYAGGDIVILSPSDQDSLYLGYLMNHTSVSSQKARMGQGDAVVHISARNLGQLQLRLPSLPEQTAIAEVLSDMDAEIAALEQRRDKTRALKQGMMQELLTGRTRLV